MMKQVLQASVALSSILWLPICTQAHMQMSSPYPLRSPLDPAVSYTEKDYDMTNPLLPDGSNFPCKDYQNDADGYVTKATYLPGNVYEMWLNGTAEHDGGSCQLSLSYDNGVSFKVIKSFVGGCPLNHNLNFTIPTFVPASNSVLLSWSWFNIVGNREMYQNCARVQIGSVPSGRYRQRSPYRRQASSMDQLPDMFACNVGNGCQTMEQGEVVFPNPGDDVVYGQDAVVPDPGPGFTTAAASTTSGFLSLTTSTPIPTLSSSGINNSSAMLLAPVSTTASTSTSLPPLYPFPNMTVTVLPLPPSSGTGVPMSNSTGNATSSIAMNSTIIMTPSTTFTILSTAMSTISSTFPTRTSTNLAATSSMSNMTTASSSSVITLASSNLLSTSTTATAPPLNILSIVTRPSTITFTSIPTPSSTSNPTPLSLPCTPGQFTCNTPTSFSQCISSPSSSSGTAYIYMGSVALGTICIDGQIIRENAGPCTPNGQLFCNGEKAFYLCDQGGLVDMGSVAAGTVCRGGVIVGL